jgi:hypothetical protein
VARATLERSLADGRGLEAVRYAVALVGLALPTTIVLLAAGPNRLLLACSLGVGFLLAAALYGITTRIVIGLRLRRLHKIHGIDPKAAEAQLDRTFRNAALTVRARFVGDRALACKRARTLSGIADAREEGDEVVVVTEYLRTRSDAAGTGSRTHYSNFPIYACVIAIAGAMPTCERFTIEVSGDS